MNDSEIDIEYLHDLLKQSTASLSDACDIVSRLHATTDAHLEAKANATKQLANAIGNVLYARTFLPQDPREMDEDPGEPDTDLTPEQQSRVDQLNDEQLQIIDDALLANATGQWRKVAMVIGSAMSDNSELLQSIPDLFYAERLRNLVNNGLLESQGNLDFMRFSEVRLRRDS